jgi:electron transfer flavoprotein alpha/beta subunit
MMKALVCFKTIPDPDMFGNQEWEAMDTHQPDLRFVKRIFNCFDESGLEIALRLSGRAKASDLPFDLQALTIDDVRADLFLRHLLAVQYDRAVRIDPGPDPDLYPDLRFNALAVSFLIASYIKSLGEQGLVILGTRGGISDNGQTGPLVAERLGWPCIRDVSEVDFVSPHSLRVSSRTDNTIITQTVRLPLVLTIGNAPESPFLRVPTLKQKLRAAKKKIEVLEFPDLGMDPETDQNIDWKTALKNDKTLTDLRLRNRGRTCVFVEGKGPKEKAEHLYKLLVDQGLMP